MKERGRGVVRMQMMDVRCGMLMIEGGYTEKEKKGGDGLGGGEGW